MKTHNPYAFPGEETIMYDENIVGKNYYPGMTLRDWFAGQAMIGFIQRNEIEDMKIVVIKSYLLADEMLDHR